MVLNGAPFPQTHTKFVAFFLLLVNIGGEKKAESLERYHGIRFLSVAPRDLASRTTLHVVLKTVPPRAERAGDLREKCELKMGNIIECWGAY